MAIELANAYVTLSVETSSLGKQVGQLFNGVQAQSTRAGRDMGQSMAKAFEQSKPDISALEDEVKRTQQKVVAHKESGSRKIEAADRKVEIAQARVNEMLQKYGDDSSQYLRANDQFITAQQKSEAETLKYESALDKLESQLGETQTALKDAQKATDETGDSAEDAANKYSKGWRGVAQRLRDTLTHGVQDASSDAAVAAERGGEQAGTFWSRAMETAVGVGLYKIGETAIKKVGGLFKNAFSGGFDRVQALDDAQQKLSGLGYEAQDVTGIMGDVESALGKTAFLYSDGASAAAGSMSALKEQGLELEGYLRLVSDATTQSNTDFNSMSQIMGKVVGDGKLTGATMQQMMYNGLQAAPMLAEAFGVTQAEVRDMASEGEISAEMFMEAMHDKIGGSAEDAADTVSGSLMLAKTSISQFGESVLTNLAPYIQSAAGYFSDFMYSLAPMGEQIGEALGAALDWFPENIDLLKTVASVLGTVVGGMTAYFAITKTIATYTALTKWIKNTTIAQKGLNGAFRANPIGLVITAITALVAGFVWAYREIGWFKDGVDAVLDVLGTGWNWLYENAISPAIDGIVIAWNWLAETFTHVWENYLQPVFEGIGTVFTWLWENILEPYIGFIMGHFQGLGELFMLVWENVLQPVFSWFGDIAMWIWDNVLSHVFSWIGDNWQYMVLGMQMYWEHILKPVFQFIGAVATWLWEKVLSPVFSWIGEHWGTILDIMKWAWDFILKPAFMAVAAIATWLWEKILSPIFTWIGDHWDEILFGMKWAWENVLKPAWDFLSRTAQWLWNDVLSPIFTWIGDKWASMSDSISNVYNNYLKPVFDKFGDIVTGLKDKFQASVDNITKVWEKLKGIAAKPIHFVINDVLNEGLIKGFNELKNLIPFMSEDSDIGAIPIPSKLKEAAGFADGGWTGPGGRLDPAGIVHADEFVVRKASRGRFERENPGLLDHVNRFGTLAGYDSGGLVRPVSGPLTSRFGAGRGRYPHAGVDWAVPVGTPVRAALAGTVLGHQPVGRTGRYVFLAHPGNRNTYYGHLSRPMVSPGQEVAKGQVIGLSGNTGNSTGPHLHFETWTGGSPVDPMKYMGGLPASKSGGADGGGWFDPLAPLHALGEKIGGWFTEKFPNGGFMVDAAKQTATGAIDGVIDWLRDVIPFMGDPEDTAKGTGTVSKGPVWDQVQNVAAEFGWGSGAEWSAVRSIVNKESSGDPNAKNPNSTASGLFQLIAANRTADYRDVPGHSRDGLGYIRNRYGTPSAALAFHNRNNWYADGGVVGSLTRDGGGVVPPGSSIINNWTRDPEWMYTNKQQDTVQDALDIAKNGARGNTYNIHVNRSGASATDIAQKLEFESRRLERV